MTTADFVNCYADSRRAEAYAKLEFARTYHLAFRDLPAVFSRHVKGRDAVDFGCGTGRSTRFVRECGFNVVGIDISAEMIAKARQIDPAGDYREIEDGDFAALAPAAWSLVLSAFTFDNVPADKKVRLFTGLARLLDADGTLVSIVSSPEIYMHEWATFSTRDFPENRFAQNGDTVRIITTDYDDARPVEDILCTDEAYRQIYRAAGLECIAMYSPLATGDEPYAWVNETTIAPWSIYVLRSRG